MRAPGKGSLFKGELNNIFEILFLAEFQLLRKEWLLFYDYKNQKSKIPSESEEIINFC